MAAEGGEEAEYETDPEDALRPSSMRRREASDDDECGDRSEPPARGARASEEDDEFDSEEEDQELEEESEGEAEVEESASEKKDAPGEAAPVPVPVPVPGPAGDGWASDEENQVGEEEVAGEKKAVEPSAVPKAGAFYMHDDRFGGNGRGRGRRSRMPGARRLWESKDDQAWVHDRFEEMNFQDARNDEERRTSKGRFRGRGNNRARATGRGYTRGNRGRVYDDNNNQNNESRAYDENNNQNNRSLSYGENNNQINGQQQASDENNNQSNAPRSVKGRGPRRYKPLANTNSENFSAKNKQYAKTHESTSTTSTRGPSFHSSNVQPDPVIPRNYGLSSSLNSASPPFYPSRSTSKDVYMTQNRHEQTGTISKKTASPTQMGNHFSTSESSSLVRGKAAVESEGHNKRYMNDSVHLVAGKSSASSQQQSHSRTQEVAVNVSGSKNHPPTMSHNQVTRASSQAHTLLVQQKQGQTPVQIALQISSQQLGQQPGSITHQASSPPQPPYGNLADVGETRSQRGTGISNTSLVGKGKISNPSGNNSITYNGIAQFLGATGAMGLAHGDQSFTPALLPVMQVGGQHHGGVGVPTVGMALPGYVAQQQLGFGNPEMTWMPVLTGGAGALGSSYCSPYIALDNSFYARTSGHTSSSPSSSGETSAAKPPNAGIYPREPDMLNDESDNYQSKPRRYSEMNFGQ